MELMRLLVSLLLLMLCRAQGPAANLGVTFMEDTELLQHAVFDFTWTPPPDIDVLEGYRLVVEHVAPDDPDSNKHSCSLTQETVSASVSRDATEYRVRAVDGILTSLPIYTCTYRARLVSLPGDNISNILNISVSYDSQMQMNITRVDLELKCDRVYVPELIMHNITLTWDLSNQHPLAREALLAHEFGVYALNSFLTLSENDIDKVEFDVQPQENVTEVVAITAAPLPVDQNEVTARVTPRRLNRNTQQFYWRAPLLPGETNCSHAFKTPYVEPTQIERESVSVARVEITVGQIQFEVDWNTPMFANGELAHYDVCVRFSEDELVGQEECDALSRRRVAPDMTSYVQSQPLPIEGPLLAVQVRAVNMNSENSVGNWSEAVIYNTTVVQPPTTQSSPTGVPPWVFGLIGAVILLTLIALVVVFIFIAYRRYCFHWFSKEDENPVHPLHAPPRTYGQKQLEVDEWEIKSGDIELLNKALGEGAFGAVYKGILKPKVMEKLSRRRRGYEGQRRFSMSCVVAVKMLKADNLVASEKLNFLKEIEMMKNVSRGDNAMRQFVVNMLGCVTTQEPMLLVLEFVSHGDLQSYLRSMRKKLTEGYFNPDEAAPYLEPSGAYSDLKPRDEEYDQLGIITERNLVDFARQIAAGMEYLSNLGILHRDLACRNVLVGEGKALKVSDFGMSRLLPPDEVYVPTSHGPLPLRWMAIEALFYRHFTTKTDVWSFGVLLWEICTMGGFPYPTTSNRDLPEMLRSGYRMEKPETCSQEVYEVMLDCWNQETGERPTFPELHKTFDDFLTQQTQDNYPYMEVLSKPYHLDDTAKTPATDEDATPINLDIEITDVDGDDEMHPSIPIASRLTRSVSQNNPSRNNLGLTLSTSNFSLRSLAAQGSLQDMQAELERQADWPLADQDGGLELPDTRYVESPTSFSRNGSRR